LAGKGFGKSKDGERRELTRQSAEKLSACGARLFALRAMPPAGIYIQRS